MYVVKKKNECSVRYSMDRQKNLPKRIVFLKCDNYLAARVVTHSLRITYYQCMASDIQEKALSKSREDKTNGNSLIYETR